MDTRDWIALAAAVVALLTLGRALWEYIMGQRWKRAEFVASQMDAFEQDPYVTNALLMLDYNERPIVLQDRGRKDDLGEVRVNDALLMSSLQVHGNHTSFTPEQAAIRDTFDVFLGRLERFEQYIESGLVTAKLFEPYLLYWIRIIADRESGRKGAEFYSRLWAYIDTYDFPGVQALCNRYGYDISVRPPSGGTRGAGSR